MKTNNARMFYSCEKVVFRGFYNYPRRTFISTNASKKG